MGFFSFLSEIKVFLKKQNKKVAVEKVRRQTVQKNTMKSKNRF